MIILLLQLWQIEINGEIIATDVFIMTTYSNTKTIVVEIDNIFKDGFEL